AMAGVKAKASTLAREAYFLEFAEKVRERVRVPLMVTGGFRSLGAMGSALASGSLDLIGLGRPLCIEPDASRRLLSGEETSHRVKPIVTGIGMVDRMALMEVAWYARQMHRMAVGKEPKPNESPLWSLAATVAGNVRGTLQTRRLRACRFKSYLAHQPFSRDAATDAAAPAAGRVRGTRWPGCAAPR
ncbi:MAG: hypothetical protein VW625_01445, partial [Perlucidibaca sp.]